MATDVLFAYAATASGITVILIELLKRVWIGPSLPAGDRRDALLIALSYLSNLVLIVLAVATHGEFQPSDILTYIGLAVGQTVVSQYGYTLISTSKQKTPSPPDASGTANTTGSV